MVQPQCRVETQPFESQQLKNNQKPSNPRLPHPPVNPCCNHPRWLSTHMIYNTLEHCRRLDASCEALRRVISRVKELVRNVTISIEFQRIQSEMLRCRGPLCKMNC